MAPDMFTQHNLLSGRSPVLLSVPHAGRDYRPVADGLRVPLSSVRPLEDRYAERLVEDALDAGIATIVANAPRLAIDLNRAPGDLDPAMVRGQAGAGMPLSPKARSGLGLIPARLASTGSLWRAALEPADVATRLGQIYHPYHAALAAMIAANHAQWGKTVLIDLHSMPPLGHDDAPDIVIGDAFGRTAASHITEAAQAILSGFGLRVACNTPYAGGHIVQHHARPARGIHALQIEVDRRLYLDAALDGVGTGLPRMQRIIAALVRALGDELTGRFAVAAE